VSGRYIYHFTCSAPSSGESLRGASNIDILVVTSKFELKDRMKVVAYSVVESPIELHLVSKRQLETWYKRFSREEQLDKV